MGLKLKQYLKIGKATLSLGIGIVIIYHATISLFLYVSEALLFKKSEHIIELTLAWRQIDPFYNWFANLLHKDNGFIIVNVFILFLMFGLLQMLEEIKELGDKIKDTNRVKNRKVEGFLEIKKVQ